MTAVLASCETVEGTSALWLRKHRTDGSGIMLRLTVTLAVALYAGLVIWGEPSDAVDVGTEGAAEPTRAVVEAARPVIVEKDGDGDVAVMRSATTEIVVPEASIIAASAPVPDTAADRIARIGDPVRVSLIEPTVRQPEIAAPADEAGAGGERMVVSGSRVNLRSGPSTANAVLASLPRGTVVEVIGPASGNWVELRDVDSGTVGFMSSNFLDPA